MDRPRAQGRSGPSKGASARLRVGSLRSAERIAALAAILLVASMFLPWFGHASAVQRASQEVGITLDVPEINRNAWEDFGFIDVVLVVTALAGLGAALVPESGPRAQHARGFSRAAAGLGSLATLLIVYRLIDPPGDGSLRAGAFIGLVAAGAISIAGYRLMQQRGVRPERPQRRERPPRKRRPRPLAKKPGA